MCPGDFDERKTGENSQQLIQVSSEYVRVAVRPVAPEWSNGVIISAQFFNIAPSVAAAADTVATATDGFVTSSYVAKSR